MTATAAQVRERPILFSTDMVLALLEGTKTQTRRVMKPQPHVGRFGATHPTNPSGIIGPKANALGGGDYHVWEDVPLTTDALYRLEGRCPYGNAGDRLWVREAFFDHGDMGGRVTKLEERVEYRATEWDRKGDAGGGWKPSIHMPRWASRILLEITDVRVERVQEISREDAMAEGCTGWGAQDYLTMEWDGEYPEQEFEKLWDSLNAKRGFGWDANPFVWVLSFKRVTP